MRHIYAYQSDIDEIGVERAFAERCISVIHLPPSSMAARDKAWGVRVKNNGAPVIDENPTNPECEYLMLFDSPLELETFLVGKGCLPEYEDE